MQFPDARILIFAKAPEPGKVKTRLIPVLGEVAAADLQQKLLAHALGRLASTGLCAMELWCAPDERHPVFQALSRQHAVPLYQQRGADLGERMHHAADAALGRADSVLLIGTDCPLMTTDYLRQALSQLAAGREVVLGPAEDGGYVLLGLRRAEPMLFSDMPWGTDRVLGLTLQRLQALELSVGKLDVLWDLDRPGDWARLQQERPDLVAELG